MRFYPDNFYHIYNRGINQQQIFFQQRNYEFFVSKIVSEIKPTCEIIAYCLMPNHFHLLIYVNAKSIGLNEIQNQQVLTRKLGTLQSSYTQAINKQENRTGSLFQQKCKAKIIENSINTCFHYIHQNPLKAKLVTKLEEWEYSSFKSYFNNNDRICSLSLARELIGLENNPHQFYKESNSLIEDVYLQKII
jgi:putative transposase